MYVITVSNLLSWRLSMEIRNLECFTPVEALDAAASSSNRSGRSTWSIDFTSGINCYNIKMKRNVRTSKQEDRMLFNQEAVLDSWKKLEACGKIMEGIAYWNAQITMSWVLGSFSLIPFSASGDHDRNTIGGIFGKTTSSSTYSADA